MNEKNKNKFYQLIFDETVNSDFFNLVMVVYLEHVLHPLVGVQDQDGGGGRTELLRHQPLLVAMVQMLE